MASPTKGLDGWLTVAQASQAFEVSEKTIRRRIKAGAIEAELVADPALGVDRWMIKPPPGVSAALVPVEILDRLEEAWKEAREATAEAARASQVAEHERDRRLRATDDLETTKAERDAAREALQAELARRWWTRRGR